MTACECGKVRWELAGGKLVLHAEDTRAVIETLTHGAFGPVIKIEHLPCQTCVTVPVA